MLKDEWIKMFREVRSEGFAVVIFNPEELRGANQNQVEDRLIELGWDVIDSLATESDPDYTDEGY